MATADGKRELATLVVAALLASVALAASMWSWGLPLSNDGPVHVFVAHVANHYDDATLGYRDLYQLNSPISSHGFFEVQTLLEPLLGWRIAWRVNNILIAMLFCWGYLAFVAALAPRRRWLGLLGFALVLQPMLYLGFLPFVAATGLCWFALAWWLSRPRNVFDHVALAALLFIAACIHVVPVTLVGLLLLALTLARSTTTPRGWSIVALGAAGAPAAVVALLSLDASAPSGELVWEQPVARLWSVGEWACAGPPWRVAFLLALVVAAIASGLARARRGAGAREESVLVVAGCLLLLVMLSLPRDLAGWQFAGVRLAPLGVGLLLALLAVDDGRPRVRRSLTISAAAFVALSVAWSFSFHAALRKANQPILRGLDAPSPPRMWYPIITAEQTFEVKGFGPYFHANHLMAVEHGGGAIYSHDNRPAIHHILRRDRQRAALRPAFDNVRHAVGEQRASALTQFLANVSEFGGLWLMGTPSDIEQAKAIGFVAQFESNVNTDPPVRFMLGRFEGCQGQLQLEGATMPLDVDVGWWPVPVSVQRFGYQPGGAVQARLPPLRCGEVWVMVAGPGGAHCDGPSPVRTTFSSGADNVLRCRVVSGAPPAAPSVEIAP